MKPETEQELSETIANTAGPFRIIGGGTRAITQSISGEILDTSALSGISLYEPGALTIVAAAGTPIAEIDAALAKEGQYLPFEPMDYRDLMGTQGTPTIGGVIAANVSGPRRIQSGAARDYMLGVRFIDGRGQILKNGGRVMKNVTGYDLVKLMSGSFGTLGVMSEVSLKVLPAPQSQATVILEGLDDRQAVTAMAKALGSPYDVSGAAHLPQEAGTTARTLLRIEGFEGSVAYRTGKMQSLLKGFGHSYTEFRADICAQQWRDIRDVTALASKDGDIWRISVRPSDGPEVGARLKAQRMVYDWGGGLIWARTFEGQDVRAQLGDLQGHATLIRSAAAPYEKTSRFHPEPTLISGLAEGLRQKFDPRGIFNPGLMSSHS